MESAPLTGLSKGAIYLTTVKGLTRPIHNKTREDSTHRQHKMVNSKIRLIIIFAGKDGEALYSQQKQCWDLTVAQIMKSLLLNSDLN